MACDMVGIQPQQTYTYISEQEAAKGVKMVLQESGLWKQGML